MEEGRIPLAQAPLFGLTSAWKPVTAAVGIAAASSRVTEDGTMAARWSNTRTYSANVPLWPLPRSEKATTRSPGLNLLTLNPTV
jgi:hypothetical protein